MLSRMGLACVSTHLFDFRIEIILFMLWERVYQCILRIDSFFILVNAIEIDIIAYRLGEN